MIKKKKRAKPVKIPQRYVARVNELIVDAVRVADVTAARAMERVRADSKQEASEAWARERNALRGENLAWARALAALIGAAMNMNKEQLLLIKDFMATVKGAEPFSMEGK
jgi:plasmid stability protein